MCILDETVHIMRTNIEIDEKLMEEAMKISGHKTKKATVEAGLKLIISLNHQEKIKDLKGKVKWAGDLENMRLDK
jgi:Arc/MetJ family transcription regulator